MVFSSRRLPSSSNSSTSPKKPPHNSNLPLSTDGSGGFQARLRLLAVHEARVEEERRINQMREDKRNRYRSKIHFHDYEGIDDFFDDEDDDDDDGDEFEVESEGRGLRFAASHRSSTSNEAQSAQSLRSSASNEVYAASRRTSSTSNEVHSASRRTSSTSNEVQNATSRRISSISSSRPSISTSSISSALFSNTVNSEPEADATPPLTITLPPITDTRWWCHCCSQSNPYSSTLCRTCARPSTYTINLLNPLHSSTTKYLRPSQTTGLLIMNHDAVNAMDKQRYTPLHVASLNGNASLCASLLGDGAVVGALTTKGYTPLHFGCYTSNVAVVQVLLTNITSTSNSPDSTSFNGNLACASDSGITPLAFACKNGNLEIVGMIIDAAFRMHHPPLDGAAGGFYDVVNARDSHDLTPLICASKNGYTDIALALINHGKADVSARDKDGWGWRMHAVQNDMVEFVEDVEGFIDRMK